MRIKRVTLTRLWDGGIDRLSVGVDGGRSLVLALRDLDTGQSAMRVFDTGALTALGPRIDGVGPGCLATLPDTGGPSRAVVVDVAAGSLRTWDPVGGELLTEVSADLSVDEAMAVDVGVLNGRAVVFVYGRMGVRECGWEARDLRTGRRLPGLGDSHYAYFLWDARITVVTDLVVVTAQETYLHEDGDVQEPRAHLHRLPGGAACGSVELPDPDGFTAALVGERRLLAASGLVYTLPGLEVVARLSGARGLIALGRLGGRVIAVAEVEPSAGVGVWLLDEPTRPFVVAETEGSGRVDDLAVAADGTVLIAAELGLYSLRPDS